MFATNFWHLTAFFANDVCNVTPTVDPHRHRHRRSLFAGAIKWTGQCQHRMIFTRQHISDRWKNLKKWKKWNKSRRRPYAPTPHADGTNFVLAKAQNVVDFAHFAMNSNRPTKRVIKIDSWTDGIFSLLIWPNFVRFDRITGEKEWEQRRQQQPRWWCEGRVNYCSNGLLNRASITATASSSEQRRWISRNSSLLPRIRRSRVCAFSAQFFLH